MNIPAVFKKSYDFWYDKCIEDKKEWGLEVNKNPFIAIESRIHEDTITDLLAHILQTNSAIKKQFITFLLEKAEDNKTIESKEEITDEDVENTEIETQYSIKKSRLDLYIKIPDQYHIIIENKIFGAKEQPDQMERYIDGINEIKNKGEVLAFYATSDGREKCQTAGKYDDKVIPLAFYSDNPKKQTIYSVLKYFKHDTLTQDFCFYLSYRFFNLQSVSILQESINKIDLCSQDCFNELFEFERDYPSISKNINAFTDTEEYFMQLLKVHALNCYLLNEFKEDDRSYDAVFDGIRVKRQAKIDNIDNKDCNVYFETKYYYNTFYMVITICSLNKIYGKIKELLKNYNEYSDYFNLYKEQNNLNKEFTYSLWLGIMDPKEIKNNENYNSYEDYIEFIFTKCMKDIFDAITEKKKSIKH